MHRCTCAAGQPECPACQTHRLRQKAQRQAVYPDLRPPQREQTCKRCEAIFRGTHLQRYCSEACKHASRQEQHNAARAKRRALQRQA